MTQQRDDIREADEAAETNLPEPGLYHGVRFADYLDWPYVNNSSLTPILRSPAHYLAEKDKVRAPSKALRFGSLCHTGALEVMELAKQYAVMPDYVPQLVKEYKKPRASKEYKELATAFAEANIDKEIVTAEEYDSMCAIVGNIGSHPLAKEWLSGLLDCEVSIVWDDKDTGLRCKARIDCMDSYETRIVDLKTTINIDSFEKAIANFHYHRQAAFYSDGIEAVTGNRYEFCIVAAETTNPYSVRAAQVGLATVAAGRDEYKRALEILAKCKAIGEWPACKDPDVWELPEWAMPK
jgi:exodeoxyribonuclease VIII